MERPKQAQAEEAAGEGAAAPCVVLGMSTLAELRSRQHGAARLAAGGASLRDVAAALGCTLERARGVLERPAMVDLIQAYRAGA